MDNKTKLAVWIITMVLWSSCAWSRSVNRDLLLSWGNFNTAASIITFNSYYTGNDYDYDAEGRWTQPYDGSRQGYCLPTENDTLGNGWCRTTQIHVNPEKNLICKLVPTGVQYVALKDIASWGSVNIYSRVVVASTIDQTGSNVKPGDKLVFKVDSIRMTDFDEVGVTYSLRLTQGDSTAKVDLLPSGVASSKSLTVDVLPNTDKVFVSFSISVDGGTKGKTPGIYIDNAHLYVIRSTGAYDKVDVPNKRNRTIKTMCTGWSPDKENEYSVSTSYDYVVAYCHRFGNYTAMLKSLNSKVLVYSYFASNIININAGDKTAWNCTSIGYNYTVKNHPEWLYTDGIVPDKYLSADGYPNNYYSRRSDPAYQQAWARYMLSRITRSEFDGVFIDEAEPYLRVPAGTALPLVRPHLGYADTQQFFHSVVPEIKAAGFDVVDGDINNSLTAGSTGQLLFYPLWEPSVAYPASAGYSYNSTANTPRVRLKEWSFFKPGDLTATNSYEEVFWLNTISMMDEVGKWNTTTLKGLPKSMLWIYNVGWDTNASGVDGWFNYSLCSYLIGQNDWTVFGYAVRRTTGNPPPALDCSITAKLGIPSSPHIAIDGDQYFRLREYRPSPDFPDSVGGAVVVNAHSDKSVLYVRKVVVIDASGIAQTIEKTMTLKPHTGRIILN